MIKRKVIKAETIKLLGKNILLQRKNIKTLRLTIDKKTGEIKINAPLLLSLTKIEDFVNRHIDWIEKNQEAILVKNNLVKNLSQLKSVFLFGVRYSIGFNLAKRFSYAIDDKEKSIKLNVKAKTNEEIESSLEKFYKKELSILLESLVAECEKISQEKNFSIHLRTMKTKLGSCKPSERKITLNTRLATHKRECIKMVLLHEIAHFKELSHNERFKKILTSYCPNWRALRKEMKTI